MDIYPLNPTASHLFHHQGSMILEAFLDWNFIGIWSLGFGLSLSVFSYQNLRFPFPHPQPASAANREGKTRRGMTEIAIGKHRHSRQCRYLLHQRDELLRVNARAARVASNHHALN